MLQHHCLESIRPHRVQDRFPRFVGWNSFGNPQPYGSSIQIRVLTTGQNESLKILT